MTEKKSNDSRRKLLKSITLGSGAVVAGKSLPESWSKPVINSIVLPAHAHSSPPASSTTTATTTTATTTTPSSGCGSSCTDSSTCADGLICIGGVCWDPCICIGDCG